MKTMQKHITGVTGVKATAFRPSLLAYIHIGKEHFRVPLGYEIFFNAAKEKNMNRAKLSIY